MKADDGDGCRLDEDGCGENESTTPSEKEIIADVAIAAVINESKEFFIVKVRAVVRLLLLLIPPPP